jgi:hypothetical protein
MNEEGIDIYKPIADRDEFKYAPNRSDILTITTEKTQNKFGPAPKST